MTTVVVALIVLGALAVLPAIWPFGPYQLSLMAARRLHRFPPLPPVGASASHETFAICLCAYNEAAVIRSKVEDMLRLRAAAGGQLDIHVYVDCASDGTDRILRDYADRIDLVVSTERRGKTYGMNLLVSRTRASIVMFTDANVRIEADAITVLRRYFSDPVIGCVCSHLSYANADASPTAKVGGAYWALNEWSKALETETGSVIGADGSLFAIRRALHEPVPKGLFDDIYVSLCILMGGRRVVRAPELRAFEPHATNARDEFRRKTRIACECVSVHRELWPRLRRLDAWNLYKYLSFRLTRWIGGFGLILGATCFAAAAVLQFGVLSTLVAIASLALLAWVALRLRLPLTESIWNIVLAFAGNTVGAWRALRGVRAVTWEPPASARQASLYGNVEAAGDRAA